MQQSFTVMFGGQAGYGMLSAGTLLAKAAGRHGLWAFVVNEYPSLIKGGLNTCQVRVAASPVAAQSNGVDFLGALSQEALEQQYTMLNAAAAVVYDSDAVTVDQSRLPAGVKTYPIRLAGLLTGETAKVMANSAMVGAFCALTDFSPTAIESIMAEEFTKPPVLEQNVTIFRQTYATLKEQFPLHCPWPLAFNSDGRKKMLINGNEAIAMGAVKGGVKFAAGYPMTPGTSILTYLADHAEQYGLVFKQTEDEIAAVNMLIGAGFAGARAIGATSGGGFSLMTEGLGFAAQGEVPLVLVVAQRGGPSTGLPTRTAQGDLAFVLHASQGEFPRIVVAPGDVEECFAETFRLLNLVEKYQVPGIVLTDKFLADSSITHEFFQETNLTIERGKRVDESRLAANQPYLRYQDTPDGVSPRAIPGQVGGRHIVTSYTHGEDGFYSSGNQEYAAVEPAITAAGLDKLFRKVPAILEEISSIKQYGPPVAELTIVSWGSGKGAILEAVDKINEEEERVNFLQVLYPAPFPAEAIRHALQQTSKILVIEGNKTGQLGELVRPYIGAVVMEQYLKYDSRPFIPAAICARIEEVLR